MIYWTSVSTMQKKLYDRAVARERERVLVEDDFVPMTKNYAVVQLEKSEQWLKKQQTYKSRTPDDNMVAQDIMMGCVDLLKSCGINAADWAARKTGRLRRLRQVKRSWKTKVGHKDLCELIRLAVSSLGAATWLRDEVLESVHLPRWTLPKTLSRQHVDKMQAGRSAQRAEEQASREARMAAVYCQSG